MDDIRLPMMRGSMEDISQEGDQSSQMEASDTPADSLSTQGAKAIYEREARIRLDYDQLPDDHKEV